MNNAKTQENIKSYNEYFMAKNKKYTHCIIVDQDKKPMIWSENDKQLVYCSDENWEDEPVPIVAYPIAETKKMISKTISNRNAWNMQVGRYMTMPFDIVKK